MSLITKKDFDELKNEVIRLNKEVLELKKLINTNKICSLRQNKFENINKALDFYSSSSSNYVKLDSIGETMNYGINKIYIQYYNKSNSNNETEYIEIKKTSSKTNFHMLEEAKNKIIEFIEKNPKGAGTALKKFKSKSYEKYFSGEMIQIFINKVKTNKLSIILDLSLNNEKKYFTIHL